jgi:tricarballylate dehydrogenase
MSSGCDVVVVGAGNATMNAAPAAREAGAEVIVLGDRRIGDGYQKHSYPFGVMVNTNGQRFVDEAAHFRNYTYAKYGHGILERPSHFAWQIFDQKTVPFYRDEYRIMEIIKVTAPTLEELAHRLDGVDPSAFLRTVQELNDAMRNDIEFNPNVPDGKSTRGLRINKSNWSHRLDTPPYEAYAVVAGVTFTFDGLQIAKDAEVLDTDLSSIPGLFAAGELVGGLFYFNHPADSGLTSGAVFGKIAGTSAARAAGVT